MSNQPPIAIRYSQATYSETTRLRRGSARAGLPQGLMGREVASVEFLRALLKHGTWQQLAVLLQQERDRASFVQHCQRELAGHPQQRHVRIALEPEAARWFRDPPAEVLHFPSPPEVRLAWARQASGPPRIAFSGVTHTLCSMPAIDSLWNLFIGPWQRFDRLICTSRAVVQMVQSVWDGMAGYLGEQLGRDLVGCERVPAPRIGIECLPLGVDAQTHRPALPAERQAARRRLGILHDQLALLFVGRLSHHAKAHPFPLLAAAQQVAIQRGGAEKIAVVLCGWFSNREVREAFERTACRIAPLVQLIIVDGLDPWWRQHVWDAADLFVSLADSIQETFGLTNLEAMAHGLPVIATDWNGYRDTVQHGQTGYLIPTQMVKDATTDLTVRLISGDINYDHFLAKVGQTVSVSINAAAEAITALASDTALRSQMGAAGRARVELHFSWQRVIKAYESIWQEQREELRRHQKTVVPVVESKRMHPAESSLYPPVEQSFASYPSHWLHAQSQVRKSAHDVHELKTVLSDPLCNYLLDWKAKFGELASAWEHLPAVGSVADYARSLVRSGIEQPTHAIIAWLLKYRFLEFVAESAALETNSCNRWAGLLTFAITCKGRLDHLRQTLPHTVALGGAVVVVDYSCPQRCGDWVEANFPQVQVIRVADKPLFDIGDAKNHAVRAAQTPWVCLVDADIVLDRSFLETIEPLLQPGHVLRCEHVTTGTGGTMALEKNLFEQVSGHDSVYQGWGEEDEDLLDHLRFVGAKLAKFPASCLQHLPHDDQARTEHYAERDLSTGHMINRLYRAAKWDLARLTGTVPSLKERQQLYQQVTEQLQIAKAKQAATITIDLGRMLWAPISMTCQRVLQYRLYPAGEADDGT